MVWPNTSLGKLDHIIEILDDVAGNLDPFSYEQLTISTSATSLTPSAYSNATFANGTVEDASIRVRVDGGIPSSTEGMSLNAGDGFNLENANEIINFKAISRNGIDSIVRITYYR